MEIFSWKEYCFSLACALSLCLGCRVGEIKALKWAATEALRQGMDEVTLMYTFGWKSLDTVKHYVNPQRTQISQLCVLSKVFDKTN